MKKTTFNILMVCFFLGVSGLGQTAHAACTNPDGVEGEMVFNANYSLLQFCDGTQWVSMAAKLQHVRDIMPDDYTFTNDMTAMPNTLTVSNAATITGINEPSPVTISGDGTPQFRVNGGVWGTSGTIENGQTIEVRLTSASTMSVNRTATITIGSVPAEWMVRTADQDTTPDSFAFTDQSNVALNTVITSNAITPMGINTGTAVSVSGSGSPQIRINGGSWTTSGTLQPGQTVEVRLTSSGSASIARTATVNIGGVTDVWSVTTYADTIPDSYTFTSNIDLPTSTIVESNTVTITGIDAGTSVSFTSPGGSTQFRINGGSWMSGTGTIYNGQTLQFRNTSPPTTKTSWAINTLVGGVGGTWVIATGGTYGAPVACSGGICRPPGWTGESSTTHSYGFSAQPVGASCGTNAVVWYVHSAGSYDPSCTSFPGFTHFYPCVQSQPCN